MFGSWHGGEDMMDWIYLIIEERGDGIYTPSGKHFPEGVGGA
jgi:hypothetical protein